MKKQDSSKNFIDIIRDRQLRLIKSYRDDNRKSWDQKFALKKKKNFSIIGVGEKATIDCIHNALTIYDKGSPTGNKGSSSTNDLNLSNVFKKKKIIGATKILIQNLKYQKSKDKVSKLQINPIPTNQMSIPLHTKRSSMSSSSKFNKISLLSTNHVSPKNEGFNQLPIDSVKRFQSQSISMTPNNADHLSLTINSLNKELKKREKKFELLVKYKKRQEIEKGSSFSTLYDRRCNSARGPLLITSPIVQDSSENSPQEQKELIKEEILDKVRIFIGKKASNVVSKNKNLTKESEEKNFRKLEQLKKLLSLSLSKNLGDRVKSFRSYMFRTDEVKDVFVQKILKSICGDKCIGSFHCSDLLGNKLMRKLQIQNQTSKEKKLVDKIAFHLMELNQIKQKYSNDSIKAFNLTRKKELELMDHIEADLKVSQPINSAINNSMYNPFVGTRLNFKQVTD